MTAWHFLVIPVALVLHADEPLACIAAPDQAKESVLVQAYSFASAPNATALVGVY
jgi:hypothetical protein